MRIGLIRHFPVQHPMPSGWMNAAQIHAWRDDYDRAAVTVSDIDLGPTAWRRCISSDVERAFVTARSVFTGEIARTPQLREPELAAFRTGRLRLPPRGWRWLLRAAWLTAHRSQRAARDDFLGRVRAMAETLESATEDTLVVSHAGMMAYLSRELRRRGFAGPKLRIAEPARLYVFERNQAPAPAPARGPEPVCVPGERDEISRAKFRKSGEGKR